MHTPEVTLSPKLAIAGVELNASKPKEIIVVKAADHTAKRLVVLLSFSDCIYAT